MFQKIFKKFRQSEDETSPRSKSTYSEGQQIIVNDDFELQKVEPKPFAFQHRQSAKKERAIADEQNAISERNDAWVDCQESARRAYNIGNRLDAVDEEESNRLLEARAKKAKLERELEMKEAEDHKTIANYNADIAEAIVREKEALDKVKEPEKKSIDAVRKELKEDLEESKIKSKHWREKTATHASGRLHTTQRLDEECKKEIKKMLIKAMDEKWSGEKIEHERDRIYAHFENEKRKI